MLTTTVHFNRPGLMHALTPPDGASLGFDVSPKMHALISTTNTI
jgi:hypothetical protein